MKKFISILISLSLCLMLFGCEDNVVENNDYSIVENDYEGNNEKIADFDPAGEIKISVLDVGQGDSILIQLPTDETVLIDAGPSDDIVDKLKEHNVEKIDYVVITHAHSDHIGGMDAVINNFEINNIYMPKAAEKTDDADNLFDAVKNKGIKLNAVNSGVNMIDDGDLKADFIAPVDTDYGNNLNNCSAVLYIIYGNRSFIFMGDAEAESESDIIENYNINADFIKIGNHGSYKSTSEELLELLKPKYAVISVGADNDFGYPNDSTLSLLSDLEVYRTDKNGEVTAVSDGVDIKITTER